MENLIIDNSQSFFSSPLDKIDTVYSPRKFFGVPDGGYLFTNNEIKEDLRKDNSFTRMVPLLKRIDIGPEESYFDYREKEDALKNNNIKKMSNLTDALLKNINYKKIKTKRKQNFNYLHTELKDINEMFYLINKKIEIPMVYPLLITKRKLREDLINNNIFVATYWNDSLKRLNSNDFEKKLVDYLIPIPIDQRYDIDDMIKIARKVKDMVKY